MLVVSDASPLNVLIRIGHIGVLPSLFTHVAIPTSVAEEMSRDATPAIVREWIVAAPSWVQIQTPTHPFEGTQLRHRGELDAISLARELKADAILLDEKKPRKTATKEGLVVIGTLGVLERAANVGLIADLKAVHDQLRQTDFSHLLRAARSVVCEARGLRAHHAGLTEGSSVMERGGHHSLFMSDAFSSVRLPSAGLLNGGHEIIQFFNSQHADIANGSGEPCELS
jgi:predicted nucleic acid-binding protein